MKKLLIAWAVNTVTLLVVTRLVPGITIADPLSAIVAALVLGLLNAFLRPVLFFLTLPFTIMTLGLFSLFINAFLLYVASKLVQGFAVAGFWSAFFGALLFSIISALLNHVLISRRGRGSSGGSRGGKKDGKGGGTVIDAEIVEERKEKK